MSGYVTPKKNTEFIFYKGLDSISTPGEFQVNPTLATGDIKVSTDGGAFANIVALPVVTPAGGDTIKFILSAAEMNGDNIVINCKDVTTDNEWGDVKFSIQTSIRQIDDIAFPDISGRSFNVDVDGAIDADVTKLNTSSAGASNLAVSANTMLTGTAVTGTLTTTTFTTDLTSSTDNIYKGRIVIFTSGSLTREVGIISAYNGTTKLITVSTALTSVPNNLDTFIIV